MKTLGLAALFLLAGSSAFPQTQATNAPASQQSAPSVDPKLHAGVLKLVEILGMRKGMIEAQTKVMPNAREAVLKGPPAVTEELADAWQKRMLSDSSFDAYIQVVINVYEKYLDQSAIDELIQLQKDKADGKTPVVSDALKAKLEKDGIALQSEIMGGCAQVGARLGGEIEVQLIKEHPEWVKKAVADAGKTN